MQVIILSAGKTIKSSESDNFPLLFSEIGNETLLEKLIEEIIPLNPSKCILVTQREDAVRFNLAEVVKTIDPRITLLEINQGSGALCSALIAIDLLDQDEELLIVNGNEIINQRFDLLIKGFHDRNLDAGVLVFDSFHPRYSFVRIDEDDFVIEAAEKKPISRNATMGFYWYKKASLFLKAAQLSMLNSETTNGYYFICPTLNHLILENYIVGATRLDKSNFLPIKSLQQLANVLGKAK